MDYKLIDLNYLNSISEDDEEFKKDMIETFLTSTPAYIDEMKSCLQIKDWKRIGDIAHSIKPSFSLMGMNENKDMLLKIENYGRNVKNTFELSGLINQLEKIIEKASLELKEELKNMN
jgi:HPt (histidine-containing phosphotransfer) domain-containing protein